MKQTLKEGQFDTTGLNLRKTTINNLKKYILNDDYDMEKDYYGIPHCRDYELFETNDNSVNPLMILKVEDWNALCLNIEYILSKYNMNKTSEIDLVIGSFKFALDEIRHHIKKRPSKKSSQRG